MNLILCDANPEMRAAWSLAFKDIENVSVETEWPTAYQIDVLVVPGTVNGFLDRGVGLACSLFFGWDLQRRTKMEMLAHDELGRCKIGKAVLVRTMDERMPYCAYAPIVEDYKTNKSDGVAFKAFKAALLSIRYSNFFGKGRFNTILAPAMEGFYGADNPMECARQMARAWVEVFHPIRLTPNPEKS